VSFGGVAAWEIKQKKRQTKVVKQLREGTVSIIVKGSVNDAKLETLFAENQKKPKKVINTFFKTLLFSCLQQTFVGDIFAQKTQNRTFLQKPHLHTVV